MAEGSEEGSFDSEYKLLSFPLYIINTRIYFYALLISESVCDLSVQVFCISITERFTNLQFIDM